VTDYRDFYRGRKVLVTGGLGFIGSNLCRTLADLGAQVLAVDSLLPDYGGNLFNLAGYEDKVRINIADVRGHGMEYLVKGQEVLFNLAGQVSHLDSMSDPFTDLEINCRSQLSILEAVRKGNRELKIVYAGTRKKTEETAARLAREHNDANVICFGGRMIGTMAATLNTEFLSKMFHDTPPMRVASAAGVIGGSVYLIALLTSFLLPSPQVEGEK